MNNVCSKVSLASQEKLKCHDGSEDQVNAMAAKTSVMASLPSLHDKPYPYLGLCVHQAILEESTFAIAIINVTFYYSATLASVYTSSATRTVCIICRILALYSENAAETISEGLKSKIFLRVFPQTSHVHALRVHLCAAGNLPCEFLPTSLVCTCACLCTYITHCVCCVCCVWAPCGHIDICIHIS